MCNWRPKLERRDQLGPDIGRDNGKTFSKIDEKT